MTFDGMVRLDDKGKIMMLPLPTCLSCPVIQGGVLPPDFHVRTRRFHFCRDHTASANQSHEETTHGSVSTRRNKHQRT